MVDIAHKDLTGDQLHEPKGADTALVDTVYIADGAGSGAFAQLDYSQLAGTPTSGGSGLVFITSKTASASATLDFEHGVSSVILDTTYPAYVFELMNIVPSTDDQGLLVRFKDAGSYQTNGSAYSFGDGFAFFAGNNVSALITRTSGSTAVSNTVGEGGYTGTVKLYKPSTAGAQMAMTFHGSYWRTDDTGVCSPVGSATYTGSTGIEGVRFVFQTGNITSGTINLYGVSA